MYCISQNLQPSIIIFIQTVTLLSVEPTPLDDFMSVRRQKCALAGGDAAPHHVRRQMPNIPIEMWPPEAQALVSTRVKAKAKKNKGAMLMGPPFSDTYAPNVGFEPYWVGGLWTLQNITETNATKKNANETKDNYCGYKCNEIMRNFGVVCGVNAANKYQTFDNLCMMKAIDCLKQKGWTMVHRGSCDRTLPTFNWEFIRSEGKFHKDAVKDFYAKYSRAIGSGYPVTKPWPYGMIFRDPAGP